MEGKCLRKAGPFHFYYCSHSIFQYPVLDIALTYQKLDGPDVIMNIKKLDLPNVVVNIKKFTCTIISGGIGMIREIIPESLHEGSAGYKQLVYWLCHNIPWQHQRMHGQKADSDRQCDKVLQPDP